MKIIVTTSDHYHHILPIFFHLYEKYWGDPLELVGYRQPDKLPDYVTFHSLGKQRGKSFFSDDMYKFFEKQDDHFIWMMEDTFIKEQVNRQSLQLAKAVEVTGRLNISDSWKDSHFVSISIDHPGVFYGQKKGTPYKLSTQPSIWKKDFLLRYMTPGLTPWDFESQESYNDGYVSLAIRKDVAPVKHNEGVRKTNLHKYNLEGIDPVVIDEMKQKKII